MKFQIGLLAAGSVLLASAALAQQGAGEIEEVVVTARKLEENIQDVPLTITAFTTAELTERGLADVMDISQFTPGFSFEKLNRYGVQGGGSRPVIRGQSQILGGANASIFVDGVLYNDSVLSFPFDIVERVEVIKGPQGRAVRPRNFCRRDQPDHQEGQQRARKQAVAARGGTRRRRDQLPVARAAFRRHRLLHGPRALLHLRRLLPQYAGQPAGGRRGIDKPEPLAGAAAVGQLHGPFQPRLRQGR